MRLCEFRLRFPCELIRFGHSFQRTICELLKDYRMPCLRGEKSPVMGLQCNAPSGFGVDWSSETAKNRQGKHITGIGASEV